MLNFYIDEKGPQETYRIEDTKDPMFTEKLKYGSDNMHNYVGAAVEMIDSKEQDIGNQLIKLEDDFKSSQMKGKELKGKDIVKNKIFEYGIASMRSKEVQFYTDLLELLNKEDVQPCIYIINKMSYLVSAKLRDWILLVSDCENINPYTLKFIFTGYLEIEGNRDDIKALLDENVNVYRLLKVISKNLKLFIKENSNNSRMLESQIPAYKQMLKFINKYKNTKSNNNGYKNLRFNWQVVNQMFDLWLEEIINNDDNESSEEVNVYLDEGIKCSIFSSIKQVDHVYGCQHSNDVPGIRIADYLAVIYGKLLQTLLDHSQYDRKKPKNQKLIETSFFDIDEKQFNLLKLLYKYIFMNNCHYNVMRDCYYKDEVRLENYLSYFNTFKTFKQYHAIDNIKHRNKENDQLMDTLKKVNQGYDNQAYKIRHSYQSYREAFADNKLVDL